MIKTVDYKEVRPFLRWAGGKGWLTKYIGKYIPQNYSNYHEPFLGGGAIFFHLKPSQRSYLSDLNEELVSAYIEVRDHPTEIINELKSYKNEEDFYYFLRNQNPRTPIKKAARFIYLNMTSFNGIYRVNRLGKYNVPYGYRKSLKLDEKNIMLISKYLKNAQITTCDFEDALDKVKKNDLIFIDPPYTVAHSKNGFIEYNQKIFSFEDQIRLANALERVSNRQAYFILTNAEHPSIKEVYKNVARYYKHERKSLIGGTGAKRESVTEFIFTNCK